MNERKAATHPLHGQSPQGRSSIASRRPSQPPSSTSELTPPETINVFDGVEISDSASQLLETVTWRTEVYKYVTRFRPDEPNFEGKGGEIFIIMAHTGTAKMGRPFLLPEYVKAVRVPSSIIPMGQYPETGSGTQQPSSDDWGYSINYTNTMPMFSNGGNNIFDFDAVYQNDFVRSKFQQTGDTVSGGVEFAAVNPRAINTSYAIHGLSVFKCLDPSAFPVKITFEAIVNDMGSGLCEEFCARFYASLSLSGAALTFVSTIMLSTRQPDGLDALLQRRESTSNPSLSQRYAQSSSFPFFVFSTIYHLLRHVPLPPTVLPLTDHTKIRLVCVSDTHNRILPPSDIPEGDVFVHAGDLTHSGSAEELQKTLDWLRSLPHQHKVFIAGNHDAGLAANQRSALDMSGLIYLCDEGVDITVRGRMLRIYGSPWTPKHGNFAFQYPRDAGQAQWSKLVSESTLSVSEPKRRLDVLITHGPPKGHVDYSGHGCDALLDAIWRVKPKVMICGHIHAGRGMEVLEWDEGQRLWESVVRARNTVGWRGMVVGIWKLGYTRLGPLIGRTQPDTSYILNCASLGGVRDDIVRPAVVLDV
ncbi:hypothetical protein EYR38_000094 [Pleurotus pulmonarius]|nr:hypothetical protein EYR38_000094 [Pleurotus pulmonarius]